MSRFKFGDMVKHGSLGIGIVLHSVSSTKGWMQNVGFVAGNLDWCMESELTPYTPPPPEGTIPVRIAVAVDAYGEAAAKIITPQNKDRVQEEVAEYLLDGQPGFCRVSVLKGDIPLPESPAEVRGEVEG